MIVEGKKETLQRRELLEWQVISINLSSVSIVNGEKKLKVAELVKLETKKLKAGLACNGSKWQHRRYFIRYVV